MYYTNLMVMVFNDTFNNISVISLFNFHNFKIIYVAYILYFYNSNSILLLLDVMISGCRIYLHNKYLLLLQR